MQVFQIMPGKMPSPLRPLRRGVKAKGMEQLMASLLQEIIAVKVKYVEAVCRADKQPE